MQSENGNLENVLTTLYIRRHVMLTVNYYANDHVKGNDNRFSECEKWETWAEVEKRGADLADVWNCEFVYIWEGGELVGNVDKNGN